MTAPGYVWFISDLSVDLDICCGRRVAADAIQSAILPYCYILPHPPDSRHSVTYSGCGGGTGNEKLRRWEHHLCLNLCHSCLATYTSKIPIRYPITSNGMSVMSNSRPGTTILLSWSHIDTTAQNTTASRKGRFFAHARKKKLDATPITRYSTEWANFRTRM